MNQVLTLVQFTIARYPNVFLLTHTLLNWYLTEDSNDRRLSLLHKNPETLSLIESDKHGNTDTYVIHRSLYGAYSSVCRCFKVMLILAFGILPDPNLCVQI